MYKTIIIIIIIIIILLFIIWILSVKVTWHTAKYGDSLNIRPRLPQSNNFSLTAYWNLTFISKV